MQMDPVPVLKNENIGLYYGRAAITFAEPLGESGKVKIYFIPKNVGKTENCPGLGTSETVPGTLCVYGDESSSAEQQSEQVTLSALGEQGFYNGNIDEGIVDPKTIGSKYGVGAILTFASVRTEEEKAEKTLASGVWVLTAPEAA